jgi:hypothetical protein
MTTHEFIYSVNPLGNIQGSYGLACDGISLLNTGATYTASVVYVLSVTVGQPVYGDFGGYPNCSTPLLAASLYWIVNIGGTLYVVHVDANGYIDSIDLCSTPTPTPTNTETPTNTPTPTPTPTNTETPTNTPTPTNTETPTNTPTPTNTETPTNTPTPTPTNTETPTNTPTPTNTETPTNTPTNTETPTNTPTNTITPTNTPTNTITPTNTPTNTITPTVTPSSNLSGRWLAQLCCNKDITGIVRNFTLSIGSIFVDNFDNCWEVIDYAMDTENIIYSSGGGKDCETCIADYGCNWEAQCCTTSSTIIVNDLAWPSLVVNQSIVSFANDACYRLNGKVVGPPTDTIVITYPGCDECISTGAYDHCP